MIRRLLTLRAERDAARQKEARDRARLAAWQSEARDMGRGHALPFSDLHRDAWRDVRAEEAAARRRSLAA